MIRSAEVTYNTSVTEAQRMFDKVESLYKSMPDVEAAKCAILSISTKSNLGFQQSDFIFELEVLEGNRKIYTSFISKYKPTVQTIIIFYNKKDSKSQIKLMYVLIFYYIS